MIPLKKENLKDLTEKVLDLVAKTSVEIGHKTDAETMVTLSKIFAEDLIQERRFGDMTFNQVQDAFRIGVRFSKDEPFLNIRTFYKWIWAHKKDRIDVARYQVEILKENPKTVPYYQSQKLLK